MPSFRARARALDMLGRQQIANIPTAISEMFKNAHDAYADRVEADLFRQKRLFVLRDNGYGMTEDDFLDKWLTLGTDSKLSGEPSYIPPGSSRRPVLGEKGIGRLAIAAVGSQVLVVSRARRGNTAHAGIAALVPWRLFALPKIDLADISVPVRAFGARDLPTKDLVAELADELRTSIASLSDRIEATALHDILADLSRFKLDPVQLDTLLRSHDPDSPSLKGGASGTHFFVHPTDDTLMADLELPRGGDKTASPMVKMLIGFSNTLSKSPVQPAMVTAFRDHKSADLVEDVASDKEFFQSEDLENADHRITGRFEGDGSFTGTVRVFDKTFRFNLPAVIKTNETFLCGPFSLQFGYLQGAARESLLYEKDPDAYSLLEAKLDRIGGLYLYRDGIRVLPYGDTDVDYLKIEERRTKGAGYYFFSYRRMFGAIDLTRKHNSALEERAGREGLRRNRAYQHLTNSLTNLLIQLAAEFFREDGSRAEFFQQRKSELEENELLRRQHEKEASSVRRAFGKALSAAVSQLEGRDLRHRVARVVADLEARLRAAAKLENEAAEAAIESAEQEAMGHLAEVRASLRVDRPKGFGLPREIQRDWTAYLQAFREFDRGALAEAREKVEVAAGEAMKSARLAGKQTKRIRSALLASVETARNAADKDEERAARGLDAISALCVEKIRAARSDLEQVVAEVLQRFATLEAKESDPATLAKERVVLDDTLRTASESREERVTAIRRLIDSTAKALASSSSPDALAEALEEELLTLRDRADADLQLTQLGMAVDIINHEFAASIRAVRTALKRMKAWADHNSSMRDLHDTLTTSFNHLDEYLKLFTPLNRRLYRTEVDIHGSAIFSYIEGLFRDRLRRHEIELDATPAFKEHTFKGYPSSFYPVFVNLVDNAIFWLSDRRPPRKISLRKKGRAMLVVDNGPGIRTRDRDAIFEQGFTRKPGGRGLGLFISRQVLERAGYSISLASDDVEDGAIFQIRPTDDGGAE